jgi:hypothetical protein
LLIALGIYGLVEHDAINDQLAAMYPQDPARRSALQRCADENPLFNRFSTAARTSCYQKYLQVDIPMQPPGIAVQRPTVSTRH